jgi:hypothetical protein
MHTAVATSHPTKHTTASVLVLRLGRALGRPRTFDTKMVFPAADIDDVYVLKLLRKDWERRFSNLLRSR